MRHAATMMILVLFGCALMGALLTQFLRSPNWLAPAPGGSYPIMSEQQLSWIARTDDARTISNDREGRVFLDGRHDARFTLEQAQAFMIVGEGFAAGDRIRILRGDEVCRDRATVDHYQLCAVAQDGSITLRYRRFAALTSTG